MAEVDARITRSIAEFGQTGSSTSLDVPSSGECATLRGSLNGLPCVTKTVLIAPTKWRWLPTHEGVTPSWARFPSSSG
jgi:hypothetical protein